MEIKSDDSADLVSVQHPGRPDDPKDHEDGVADGLVTLPTLGQSSATLSRRREWVPVDGMVGSSRRSGFPTDVTPPAVGGGRRVG